VSFFQLIAFLPVQQLSMSAKNNARTELSTGSAKSTANDPQPPG